MGIDGARIDPAITRPDAGQQFIARQHATDILEQDHGQLDGLGAVVVGVSFLVPEGPLRTVLWVVGGIPGGLAWVGYPAVWLCVAATAR